MPSSRLPGLEEFLRDYPLMAFRPAQGAMTVVFGELAFRLRLANDTTVEDCFELKIEIPPDFPKALPQVTELGKRIPKDGRHHVNPSDGTLCLGSPIRLLIALAKKPTLVGFAENCLIPYLFAISQKLKNGKELQFGELAHGNQGLIADYMDIFGLRKPDQICMVISYLGMKKRRANKLPCPCGCKKRLGKCTFNFKIRQLRGVANRSWFRNHHRILCNNAF